ncbi:HPF/RaiA family ribosome-associated protein [bacterium]|nr:HPF/RaiA family ribosome-associated protein [bacterium]
MITIRFKNLKQSEFIKRSIENAFSSLNEDTDLPSPIVSVTVEMQNSPLKAGKDHFVVCSRLWTPEGKALFVKKSGENIFDAISECARTLTERISKQKNKRISQRRLSL